MPDVRHFNDQKYCFAPACRKASKKASHQQWLMSDKGVEYRDPEENKRRVREWRKAHPEYWKRKAPLNADALQYMKVVQGVDVKEDTNGLAVPALQEMTFSQRALTVGLIASLTGCALQETIEKSCDNFVLLGLDILNGESAVTFKGERQNDRKAYSEFKKNP